MSLFQFITSESPIEEIQNPHIEHLSIRQARDLGMELPNFIDENPDIDVDQPIISICDSEEHLDDIEIKHDLGFGDEVAEYSRKEFSGRLFWRYSPKRVLELEKYLRKMLEQSKEVEVWSIWLDESAPVRIKSTTASKISAQDLKFLDISEGFTGPECLIIKRTKKEKD